MPTCPHRRKLMLVALMSAVPMAWSAEEPEGARHTRLKLADAFATQDRPMIASLILDVYGGLRLFTFSEANSAYWEEAGQSLREARFVSFDSASGTDTVVYAVHWPYRGEYKQERRITFDRRNAKWVLDFASFMGPFPHFYR